MSHSDEKKSGTPAQVYDATSDIHFEEAPGLDLAYHAKAGLLNNAIQEIGMCRYQVRPQPYSSTTSTNLWPVSTRYPSPERG